MIVSRDLLHVVLSLAPGGAERLVVDLSLRLDRDIPTGVCCLDAAGPWAEDLERAGIPVVVLGRRPGFRPSLALQLAEMAHRFGTRVLHCHQYTPFVYGALAALRRPALRVVFTEHGRLAGAVPSRRRRWANAVLGRVPVRIAAVSHELRGHMLAEGFAPPRVDVIHNGIDPGQPASRDARDAARDELGIPRDVFVVGTVGRFDPVKRLDVLVEAFVSVAYRVPGARLVMIGGGTERPLLERAIRERGLAHTVTLPGPRPDARRLLPAFDVFANTSSTEGVSLTILEAMAAALPVVATAVGGTPEVLNAACGVLVAPDAPAAAADAIVQLAADAADRQRLGAAGRERVLQHFSFDEMARRYLEAYRGVPRPA